MINWGIIGAGNIAVRFVQALQYEENSCLYAVSCRSQAKADAFAQKYGAVKSYEGFNKIVEDSEVDVVYIALPHPLHHEWICRCLRAHKAVLCEKPACMNAAELEEVIQCAKENHTLFMEAMKTRFVPAYKQIKEHLSLIGEIHTIHASLGGIFDLSGKNSYHTQPEAGGALLDTGIYCASLLEDFLGNAVSVENMHVNNRSDGLNLYVKAFLKMEKGRGILECAFDRNVRSQAVITGSEGTVTIYDMHRPRKADIRLHDGRIITLEAAYEHDDFYSEIHAFVNTVLNGDTENAVMPMDASLACARILDMIRAGFSVNEDTLSLLKKQEEELDFPVFDNEDALKLGNLILSYQKAYDSQIAVEIIRENDALPVFRCVQDACSQRNLTFMHGKRNSALKAGHSSYYAYVENILTHNDDMWSQVPDEVPAGGAYPIRVKGEWKYTVMVSGLHEGCDHELIVKALYSYLDKDMPSFPFMVV